MSVDSRGVTRGVCEVQGCSCSSYLGAASGGMKCDKCGHPPGKHSKSSMTAPSRNVALVQSFGDDDESPASSTVNDSSSEDEATAQPVSTIRKIFHSLPSPFQKKPPPPPRRDRPRPPPSITLAPNNATSAAPRPPKPRQAFVPFPTCGYPNCDQQVYFDLNTREESPYCSQHRLSAPPVAPSLPTPMDTDTSLHTQFSPMHIGGDDSRHFPTGSLEDDAMSPLFYHTTPVHHRQSVPNITPHQQLAQTMFSLQSPPQYLVHPSPSAPNLQPGQPPARPPPLTTPPQPPVPLLPDGVRCKYPLCNKKRYQEGDKLHEFCGKTHASKFAQLNGGAAAVPPGMKCKTPSCTRSRRAHENGDGYYDYCGMSCRDGNFRTSQSDPQEPCSYPGCTRQCYVDPANGRVHDYCGRTHANAAQAKGIAPQVCSLKLLSSSEVAQVQAHFQKEWAKGKGACPPITCVFQVTNNQLEGRWNAYRQKLPHNLQAAEKYFHGTKLMCDIVKTGTTCTDKNCGICGISKFGMYRECIRKNINFQRFGHGFYFAPNSSKCHDYTQGVRTYRAMLLVDILPGKKHTIFTTQQDIKGPPDGCHSVFGKAGQSLNYPELVVYNPDCVMPRYIIVYVLNGVHKIA